MAKRKPSHGKHHRKTFRKKTSAKNSRRKGQTLYKVKSGWRLRTVKKRRK